jgi:hypothetical protein
MFSVCRLPSHFNFTRSVKERFMINKYFNEPVDPSESYPMSVTQPKTGYLSEVNKLSHYPRWKKYDYNYHSSFTHQGVNYYIHSPYEMFSKFTAKHQSIANFSMIVYLSPQKTIIDEALESYEPKRFEVVLRFLYFIRLLTTSDATATWRERNR